MEPNIALLLSVVAECRELFVGDSAASAWEKSRLDGTKEWVTSLDVAVEKRIAAAIKAKFPSAGIVGEEIHSNLSDLDADYCFVIDPIDGTKEFLAGRDGYSICVALLHRRKPVLGILDFPARRQTFCAQRGEGASLNGGPCQVSNSKLKAGRLRVAVSPAQAADPGWVNLDRSLPEMQLIPTGALGSKLAGVASGQFDAAFFLAGEKGRAPVWDFAAAGLILQEAGGAFTSLDGGDLLDSLPALHTGGWLASNGLDHLALLEILARAVNDDR